MEYLFDADDSVAEVKALDSLLNGAISTQIQEKVENKAFSFQGFKGVPHDFSIFLISEKACGTPLCIFDFFEGLALLRLH